MFIEDFIFDHKNGHRIRLVDRGELENGAKWNAIDNPYGTCHARINGNCPYAEEHPCLTCNGGSPCKDLAIGFSELDQQKYELLIKTTTRTVEALEKRGREEIVEKNKKNLERYQNILNTIEGVTSSLVDWNA